MVQLKNKFWPQFMDLTEKTEIDDKIVISDTRITIKLYIQKLYQYMNWLPTNLLFDAASWHIFTRCKFDKDTQSRRECP